MTRVNGIRFNASDEAFDPRCIIIDDVNERSQDAKMLLEEEIGVDDNWTPREGLHDTNKTSSITHQVLRGLIPSESVLKAEKHWALHLTLTGPSGRNFKSVNGHEGILVSAENHKRRPTCFLTFSSRSVMHVCGSL
jgi:hypothetical protein